MATRPACTGIAAFPKRHLAVACATLAWVAGGLLPGTAAADPPTLPFSAYAQVYGYLNTQISSPLLGGDVSFTINGPQVYLSNYAGSQQTSTGVASVAYNVAAGAGGTDPVYDLVTDSGRYGFSYTGEAEVARNDLRTRISSSTVDGQAGTAVDYTTNTYQYSYASAQWNQGFYIAPTATRAAGTYGAIIVGVTLDGTFPAPATAGISNNSWAQVQARSQFTDLAGVSYDSNFSIYTTAGDASWTGSQTVYKKLLFQFGTPFSFNFNQYVGAGNNGSADFFSTGKISQIELPFGATLLTGSEQAGLGGASVLFGSVINSATDDAINTNWDFGNNGGGFTPQVPEPQTWALMVAGLLLVGGLARRRQA